MHTFVTFVSNGYFCMGPPNLKGMKYFDLLFPPQSFTHETQHLTQVWSKSLIRALSSLARFSHGHLVIQCNPLNLFNYFTTASRRRKRGKMAYGSSRLVNSSWIDRKNSVWCYVRSLTCFCWAGFGVGVSSDIVTGPSFWMLTCMYAPNFPSENRE